MSLAPRDAIAVGIGGLAGAGTRWALVEALPATDIWPWGVLAVNLAGCLVLGYLAAAAWSARAELPMTLGLGTGFCGSLTTFSALTVDVANMARDGDWGFAAGYLALSVLGGVALAVVGAALRKTQVRQAQ
ncbi:fluoride efflux transporter FluC [Candidatus Poriferisocius sp.]|uniref:fluoride efflux transporter FluC n=1 Tax=Candidatus Poriferisocius sp. TaxID=3101276 RepID=UPI003B0245D2